jgi:hypothetical protein
MSEEQLSKEFVERVIDLLKRHTSTPKLLWTLEECSEATSIGLTKLNEWVREERCPVFYIKEEGAKKGMVRIPVKEFELWIRSHTKKPA